jgi:hypothetical protein
MDIYKRKWDLGSKRRSDNLLGFWITIIYHHIVFGIAVAVVVVI